MIMRLIVGLLILYILYRIIKGWKSGVMSGRKDHIVGEDLVEDPYCHTYIPVSDALRVVIKGEIYFFCSKDCQKRYLEGMRK